jgi:mRNA-degrading endonuclease RelE of RelBE toxin-antitoxin system
VSEYELVLTPPARRALAGALPEAVAAAVVEFLTTALAAAPRRVGKPLRFDLDGVWSARRGTYRVLYRIKEDTREVVVLRVEHRRDAYRPL